MIRANDDKFSLSGRACLILYDIAMSIIEIIISKYDSVKNGLLDVLFAARDLG